MADKRHIYHGSLDQRMREDDAFDEKAEASGHIMKAPGAAQGRQESATMNRARQEHERKMAAFESQKSRQFDAVPTNDLQVKARLREYGEPICMFGEGPYERRERLRGVLAGRGDAGAAGAGPGGKGSQERFFTEGSQELKLARRAIAAFSLKRTKQRLAVERVEREQEGPLEEEERLERFHDKLRGDIVSQLSQIGDNRPLTCGRISPDGQSLCTGGWSGLVKLWSIPDCKHKITFKGHEDRVHGVAFEPTGNFKVGLATGSADSLIRLYSLTEEMPVSELKGHEERVNKVLFHPSGRYLASTSHDATWRMWDIEAEKELLLQEGHARGTYALAFHPDGSLILTTDLGGIARLWDLRTGRSILPLQGHVKQTVSADFHPKGNLIATGSDDHTMKIWDIRKRRCWQTVLAHNKLVSDIQFEPEHGRYILTASYDCTLKLWSSLSLACTKVLVGHEARVMAAHCSREGLIASVAFDRTFKLWSK
mmetsp:Transcript_74515/g.170900  ORF Transcript_74515/g.170900 Transcript_74515/m.170900 type:complete len:483 (-) Transcript_74515:65-1513(-)